MYKGMSCISISSSAETVSADYLQVYYPCLVWSVLQQEPPGGVSGPAGLSTQDVDQRFEAYK